MKFIDLDSLELDSDGNDISIEQMSSDDIAVIGMSGRFASAQNVRQFWDLLSIGADAVTDLSSDRALDLEPYLQCKKVNDAEYLKAGFLPDISNFDYSFFNLSPKEAALMDPNQRLFLQEVWSAIEDAGYGGNCIKGTKTGVFVGYSSDFGDSYKNIICTNDPESIDSSIAGNVKSIIATRISFLLDLKGPAIMIDTACSSALVAIHQACRSLRLGESDICITGSIKIITVPVRSNNKNIGVQNISGVESVDGKTRTFDNSATGTGMGEGAGVIILKPLAKAINDKDNILAVIKGSAVNQDGLSVGITAPNSSAQEDVIVQAWNDARVSPESISYIEAHGTGTTLGDPIEIRGIANAFRRFTAKQQFCAVGSVKSNIGHLDQAAGIAGVIKIILALQHNQLPSVVHFKKPNQKIDFIDSPVYVNDKLKEWQLDEGDVRRAGISAFGLSGTNCHIVFEEAPKYKIRHSEDLLVYFIPLSALNEETLLALVSKYINFIDYSPNLDLLNLMFTASIGRRHDSHRLMFVFKNINELRSLLQESLHSMDFKSGMNKYYGIHLIYNSFSRAKNKNEITTEEQNILSDRANNIILNLTLRADIQEKELAELADLYTKGANVDWDSYFKKLDVSRISIPTYPFMKKKCWVESNAKPDYSFRKFNSHPLVDNCVLNTDSVIVFSSMLSTDKNWELADHKIKDKYVLPGTSYIEMICEQMSFLDNRKEQVYVIEDLYFLQPFVVSKSEVGILQTLITLDGDTYKFKFLSSDNSQTQWQVCAEGKITKASTFLDFHNMDLNAIIDRLPIEDSFNESDMGRREIEIGARWSCNQSLRYNKEKTEFLAISNLDEAFLKDLDTYYFHPALSDCAVNAINFVLGEILFLPFSYKKITMLKKLENKLYSYFKLHYVGSEISTMDITIMNQHGNVLADINNYSIKKTDSFDKQTMDINHQLHQFNWIEDPSSFTLTDKGESTAIVFCKEQKTGLRFNQFYQNIIIVIVSDHAQFEKIDDNLFVIGNTLNGYQQLFETLSIKFTDILFAMGLRVNSTLDIIDEKATLKGLFKLTKTLLLSKVQLNGDLFILSENAYSVIDSDKTINPFNAAVLSMAETIRTEYPQYRIKTIDFSTSVQPKDFGLIFRSNMHNIKALRNGKFYIRQLQLQDHVLPREKDFTIKEKGVYVITGGTGGLGMIVAEYLASKAKIKLLLVNRSKFPDRSKWDQVETSDVDDPLKYTIKTLKKIEYSGSQIEIYSCDVSVEDEVNCLSKKIQEKFGMINGVFHCAGIAGNGFLINKNYSQFNDTLKSKIDGCLNLFQVVKDIELDFFVMFSSITSFLPVAGQTDYAAANAFMDAFSQHLTNKGLNSLSINWPAWNETGMAMNHQVDFLQSPALPIDNKTALELLEKAMQVESVCAIPFATNSTYITKMNYEFPFALAKNIKINISHGVNEKKSDIMDSGSVLLLGIDGEPSELMQKIAKIWKSALGINEIDIHDSFYNLGGNSILAMEMLKLYDKILPNSVDVADIFTYTTIYDMDKYLQSKFEKKEIKQAISALSMEDILYKLANGTIMVEDAAKLM